MASVNKVILVGNLGQDPDVKTFQNGDKVANLRVATSESWKDKQTGEKKERTEWHSVAIHGGLVEIVERFLRKGSKVYLEGQLATRKWQDQAGNDRYTTEIQLRPYNGAMLMLDGAQGGQRQDGGQGGGQRQGGGQGSSGGQRQGGMQWDDSQNGPGRGGNSNSGRGSFADDLDDDIPF